MMRDLIHRILKEANQLENYKTGERFEAIFSFGDRQLRLLRQADQVLLEGQDRAGENLVIRYCIDRNWLPLHTTQSHQECACDEDDLWEQGDLAFVLALDRAWSEYLGTLGDAKVEVR